MSFDSSMYDEDRWAEAEEEAARERYIEELFDFFLEEHGPDIRSDAIGDFTRVRLQSYYWDNPDVAKAPLRQLKEARTLLHDHPSASLVMAGSALEVGIKAALLKPIVYGVVHQDWLADAVAELAIQHSGLDRFKSLLLPILNEYSSVDPLTFVRSGATNSLWQEVHDVQKNRNKVVHRAAEGTLEQAEQAIGTAAAFLETILPAVLESIGMKLDGDEIVEQDSS